MSETVLFDELGAATFRPKVPIITWQFWAVKLLTTAMGEAASDYGLHWSPLVAILLATFGFAASLVVQFRLDRYNAWAYWLVVAMVSVFGTMAADISHAAGLSHSLGVLLFTVLLGTALILWRRQEGTLSVHSIFTRRRETYYWIVVFLTFSLGTAGGDWTADSLHLGNLGSAILFAMLIAVPAIGYWKVAMNEILAFWFAYIMTRPLGASLADWLSRPPSRGGLGFGTGHVALVLTIAITLFVAYLSVSQGDKGKALPLGDFFH
jgi:uncharacterized membrane-anchored protein